MLETEIKKLTAAIEALTAKFPNAVIFENTTTPDTPLEDIKLVSPRAKRLEAQDAAREQLQAERNHKGALSDDPIVATGEATNSLDPDTIAPSNTTNFTERQVMDLAKGLAEAKTKTRAEIKEQIKACGAETISGLDQAGLNKLAQILEAV